MLLYATKIQNSTTMRTKMQDSTTVSWNHFRHRPWAMWIGITGALLLIGCGEAEGPVGDPAAAEAELASAETVAGRRDADSALSSDTDSSAIAESAGHASPTFTRDIAPIMFQRCAMCHRPGQSAPFSLLSYLDVKSRAQQVADVTADRYMPPWMPEPGEVKFKHERRLSDRELDTIQRWVADGTLEGRPSDMPPVPDWPEGWQLGEPDLVITMEKPYILRADGPDVFRQFVIPVPISEAKYVRAVELLPGNKRVVHHANIIVDRTQSSRRLDAEDEEVGYSGMESRGEAERPEGQFLTWVPGRVPSEHPPGMAWRLGPGTDLILQFHMFPSGKRERIQPTIGLYFCPPPKNPAPVFVFLMDNRDINIAPGEKDYVLTDDFELPIDVDVLGVYPHAHYVGKEIQGYATLPDGTRKWLIHIKDWDFNWQDVYHYEEPLHLPKGSVLSMRYSFDNSAENPRNPNQPPRRVVGGNGSQDEMCHLWPQVLASSQEDLTILKQALSRHFLQKYQDAGDLYGVGLAHLEKNEYAEATRCFRQLLAKNPNHVRARVGLGVALKEQGRSESAIRELRAALRIEPNHPEAHVNLAMALRVTGDSSSAVRHLEAALREKQDLVLGYVELAELRLEQGELALAAQAYRKALSIEADNAAALNGLGRIEHNRGDLQKAGAFYQRALAAAPDDVESLYNWAILLGAQGKLDQAQANFQKALRFRPDSADILYNLGIVYARKNELDKARDLFEKVLVADPGYTKARESLARLAAQPGNADQTVQQYKDRLQANPQDTEARLALAKVMMQQRRAKEAQEHFTRALQVDPQLAEALNGLGTLARLQGDHQKAVQYYQKAISIQPENYEAIYYLATILGNQGKLAESAELLQKAVEIKPDSAPLHLGLGLVYERLDDLSRAKEQLEHVLRIEPAHVQALHNLAQLQLRQGNVEQASETFAKLISINPQDARARVMYGALLAMENREEADRQFQQALEIEPTNARLHNELGNLLLKLKNDKRALAHFRQSLAHLPNSVQTRLSIMWIQSTSSDPSIRDGEQAVQVGLRLAEATQEQEPLILDRLAIAYAEAGEFDEAVTTATKALDLARTKQPQIAEQIRDHLALFRQQKPLRNGQ